MIAQRTEVVFLTNFSEGCARAIPAVARMAERPGVRLTLLHASDPRRVGDVQARESLDRFFPEADGFPDTRRVTYAGPLLDAVRDHLARRAVDLLLAPGLGRARPLRLGASPRAALIAACPVPVWTVGARVSADALRRPPRRIACWLDPHARNPEYLHRAARLAGEVGGELHVLHVVPDFLEGQAGTAPGPLCADEVAGALRGALGHDAAPVIHVSPGGWPGALRELVRGCAPDLLVLGPRDSPAPGLLGPRVHGVADQIDCPILCVGPEVHAGRAVAGWSAPGGHRARRLTEA